jgi:alpha-tubulin suppressor-like RCC1 family protein
LWKSPEQITHLSIEKEFGCLVTANVHVSCWGDNSSGQLGRADLLRSETPLPLTTTTAPVTALALSSRRACLSTADKHVLCWGANQNQVAITERPAYVAGLSPAIAVYAGPRHSCAILRDGTARCWGSNESGQLGPVARGPLAVSPTPITTEGWKVRSMALGGGFTCAEFEAHGVRCFGAFHERSNDERSPTRQMVDVDLSALRNGVVSLAAGSDHACALDTAGRVACWGANDLGQAGERGDSWEDRKPIMAASYLVRLHGVTSISASISHTCALAGSQAYCWGKRQQAPFFGTYELVPRIMTVPLPFPGGVTRAISLGASFSCAVNEPHGVTCWGADASPAWNVSQLNPNGSAGRQSAIVPIGYVEPVGRPYQAPSAIVAVAAGAERGCLLRKDGRVECWQPDLNDLGGSYLPASVVPGLAKIVSISGNAYHFCALDRRGGIFCWGRNDSGQLSGGSPWSPRWVQGYAP